MEEVATSRENCRIASTADLRGTDGRGVQRADSARPPEEIQPSLYRDDQPGQTFGGEFALLRGGAYPKDRSQQRKSYKEADTTGGGINLYTHIDQSTYT